MAWTAAVIAALALAFTIGSFWWMNWRRGSLTVTAPGSFAATTQQDRLILLLPFVFYNDGPVPYVVRDLRLLISDEPEGMPLTFQRVRSGVSPSHSRLI